MSGKDDLERNILTQAGVSTTPLYTTRQLAPPKASTWKGILIEHHLQPPAECTLQVPRHTICLLLNDCQTERRVNGGRLHSNHAQRGEVIVYPATSEHWVRWQEQAEFLLLFLEPDLVIQAANQLTRNSRVEISASTKENDDPLMLQIALALKAEIDGGQVTSSALYAEALTNALAAHLLRHYTVWKPTLLENDTDSSVAPLRHVIEYIHDNLDQQLSLTELSHVADMSTYHFARTFKRVTGETPHQYVLRQRIEQARNLLLQGKLPISEIATKVGFFDQSHFTRAFKHLIGMTPQAFLRQNSKNIPD